MNVYILWTLGVAIVIAVLWQIFLRFYLWDAVRFYRQKGIFTVEKVSEKSEVHLRLMKLFFFRQQTFEFSGYAILVFCIIILGICVLGFIYANQIVLSTTNEDLPKEIRISPKDQIFWISTLSLRIGISIVVFFICQVLLKLYRHCVRRAMFYIGLFDVMMLKKNFESLDVKALVEILSPNIDIDKEPEMPIKELVDLADKLKALK